MLRRLLTFLSIFVVPCHSQEIRTLELQQIDSFQYQCTDPGCSLSTSIYVSSLRNCQIACLADAQCRTITFSTLRGVPRENRAPLYRAILRWKMTPVDLYCSTFVLLLIDHNLCECRITWLQVLRPIYVAVGISKYTWVFLWGVFVSFRVCSMPLIRLNLDLDRWCLNSRLRFGRIRRGNVYWIVSKRRCSLTSMHLPPLKAIKLLRIFSVSSGCRWNRS